MFCLWSTSLNHTHITESILKSHLTGTGCSLLAWFIISSGISEVMLQDDFFFLLNTTNSHSSPHGCPHATKKPLTSQGVVKAPHFRKPWSVSFHHVRNSSCGLCGLWSGSLWFGRTSDRSHQTGIYGVWRPDHCVV